ncbi:HEPN domain-containing protein [Candidatus Bathyarchaeota archaeon]|nr:HEPN domain-containing protein [Candidatus Bathyarchaeota archaeon]
MIDPSNEVKYKLKLAERYLMEACRSYRRRDYGEIISYSQLSAENSAEAIIAVFRIPSWSNDPSGELLDIAKNLPENIRGNAIEVAESARTLAPEHGRSVYGELLRGLTPWDIYNKEDAEKALKLAEKTFKKTIGVLRGLKTL